MFYKNALLHGLNITTCLSSTPPRIQGRRFRTYWLCLNAAYTHEFFLQTLVKRRLLEQRSMLRLNWLLMVGSSLAALEVLRHHVDWRIALASLVFNFANRKHDVANTLCIAVAFSVWGHDRLPCVSLVPNSAIRRATHLFAWLLLSVAPPLSCRGPPSYRRASQFEAKPLNRIAKFNSPSLWNDACCDKVGTRPARSDDRRRRLAQQPALQPAPHFCLVAYRRRRIYARPTIRGLGVRTAGIGGVSTTPIAWMIRSGTFVAPYDCAWVALKTETCAFQGRLGKVEGTIVAMRCEGLRLRRRRRRRRWRFFMDDADNALRPR